MTHLALPFYLLIVLQVADVITTIIALDGPAHEANPLLSWLMDRLGVVPTLVMVKGTAISFFWYYQDQLPVALMWGLCAFYLWIVYGNIRTIQHGKS